MRHNIEFKDNANLFPKKKYCSFSIVDCLKVFNTLFKNLDDYNPQVLSVRLM